MSLDLAAVGPDGFGTYAVDFVNGAPVFERVARSPEGVLCPGFIDVHIHGAFGADFMSSSSAELSVLCSKLREVGYEGLLATTVTARVADVQKALDSLPDDPMVLGVHLEGPFISPAHPGAQPAEAIQDASRPSGDWESVFDDPRLKIVTLAPEAPGGMALLKRLVDRGVVVSLGHTAADRDQSIAAFEAGALHTTHTFNAMRGLHHRDPGLVGAALTTDGVRCELIYDRIHVDRAAADVLFRCKGPDGVLAVSDSTAATGSVDGATMAMWGHDVTVKDGAVRLASNGALAGSAVTLLDCFRNLCDDFGPEAAIRACSLNPRSALSIGRPPDTWVQFGPDLQVREIHRAD